VVNVSHAEQNVKPGRWRVALVARQAAAEDALLMSDKHLVAMHIAQHILTQAQQRGLLK